MAKKKVKIPKFNWQNRTHRVAFLLNDKEYETLQRFYSKYRIANKSKCVREVLMRAVLQRLSEDAPTLFDQPND